MQRDALWRISVTCSPDAEEPASALFEHLLSAAPSVYIDQRSQLRTVTVYLPASAKPRSQILDRLRASLTALRAAGLAVRMGPLRLQPVARKEWAESWRRHFRPLSISGRLLIKPSWSRRRPGPGQSVVVLDPGLAFGTGQHPTTEFCLRQLVRERPAHGAKSFLDLGTGSGILAISAAKLGYRPVHGLDNDPLSLKVARANARGNQVGRRVQFKLTDVAELPSSPARPYDLICANLIFDLLVSHRDRIAGQLAAGGKLVVAGILKPQFAAVRRAYESSGFKLAQEKTEKEWKSALFCWKE